MDIIICERFHSHVFSVMLEKVFLSISHNKKCLNFMNENKLDNLIINNLYNIILNIRLNKLLL